MFNVRLFRRLTMQVLDAQMSAPAEAHLNDVMELFIPGTGHLHHR